MILQIYASVETIIQNFGKTAGSSFAILVVFGLIAGALISTLGSRIDRLAAMDAKTRESSSFGYLSPIGICWSCGTNLALWQQIPLLSFVFLRRKCHYCSEEIPWRYPLTEALTASLLLICMLRWVELKVGIAYFVFFSGIILAFSITLRGILIPTQVTFVLCLLGVLASALDFGQLTPRDAIFGATLGYVIPYIYNRFNVRMNPHLHGIQQVHMLLFASIGSWLGPMIAFEMMVVAILIILGLTAVRKPHPLTFDYQMALVGLLAFLRILLS